MNIEELERLEKAATGAPWHVWEDEIYETATARKVAETYLRREDNAALIAAARNALPALLEAARAVRAYVSADVANEQWYEAMNNPLVETKPTQQETAATVQAKIDARMELYRADAALRALEDV